MEKQPNNIPEELQPERKNFFGKTCNALLSITKPIIPDSIEEKAKELNLKEKPELHISVIAYKNGRILSKFLESSPNAEEIRREIKDMFLNETWKYELLPEYFLMEKHYTKEELEKTGHKNTPEHTRSTLIQKINMESLKDYYSKLSELTGINFEIPPAHVTLFSGSDYQPMENNGLGIYSEKDFDTYLKSKL
jgi:hypothetical protein